MMQEEEIIYEASGVIEEVSPEVVEVEIFEAFQAPTAGDAFNHALLANREIPNAHPITAITGLREKLDSIEALQTVYSDKKGNADYYEWADGHALGENGVGYFVSLNQDARTISICTGDDIFGVVVDNAAFVGGQDDIARDAHYGLVATSGAVHVRCELDVAEGDYVVSNAYGIATTASSGRGYKVVALHDIKGVPHATINLTISADQIDLMGAELQDLDSRMDAAETNIVSAINVANEAHKRSLEAATSSSVSEEAVKDALDSILNSEHKIEELEQIIGSSNMTATQAKAIAESAVTAAASARVEAIEKTKEALAETSELRKEFETRIEQIDTELDNTVLELEATKEDILEIKEELQQSIEDTKADVNATNDEIKKDISDTKTSLKETQEDIISLQEDIEPLASWPAGSDNPTGIAGFVTQVDENSATLGSLVEWQGETDKSIAVFKQEVADNYATQAMLSEVGDNLTLFKQEVSDTYATQEMVSAVDDNLAKYKQEVTDTYATQEMVSSVDDALTSYKQEVSKNYATQQMLSSVEDNITSFKQEVSDTYATQEMVTTVGNNLASFKQEVENDYATQEMVTNVDNALTSYKQEVEKNYATQQMLSSVENNLASYKQEVTDTYATQQMVTAVGNTLASYKQEVTDTYATQEMVTKLETDTTKALADYKQEVQDEYATQEIVTKLETDTSKALADYKQEVGKTYATNTSLANLKTETTQAIAASEEKATTTYASKSDLTSFESKTNIAMARIEQKADANGAYIQSTVSNMDKYSVGPYSQAYGFTLNQATSVLEEGMFYVPTSHETLEAKTKYHTEEYKNDDNAPVSPRTFVPWYLYQWTKIGDYYGWMTVDKNNNPIKYDETAEENRLNTAGCAVYFASQIVPNIAENPQYGYWYTDGDTSTGSASEYEPYTLYKWDLPYKYQAKNDETGELEDVEEYRWVAVATLAGNSQSRAVSQIRQDANSIEMSVTTLDGKYAGTKAWVDKNESAIQDTVTWANQNATVKAEANNDGSSVTIAAYSKDTNGNITEKASLVLSSSKDDSTSLMIDADHINLSAQDIDFSVANSVNFGTHKFNVYADEILFQGKDGGKMTFDASNIDFTGDDFSIDADRIQMTGTTTFLSANDVGADGKTKIDGGRITTGVIKSAYYEPSATEGVYAKEGTCFDLDTGNITSTKFSINDGGAWFNGTVTAQFGDIGGWDITPALLKSGKVGLSSMPVRDDDSNPIRIYAGNETATEAQFKVYNDGSMRSTKGDIGGWKITEDSICSAMNTDGTIPEDATLIYSGNTMTYNSFMSGVDESGNPLQSPVRFSAGGSIDVEEEVERFDNPIEIITLEQGASRFDIGCPGKLVSVEVYWVSIANVDGTNSIQISSDNYEVTVDLDKKTVRLTPIDGSVFWQGYGCLTICYCYSYEISVRPEKSNVPVFKVLADGSLYASAAEISGVIDAPRGTIGGLTLDHGIKGRLGDFETFELSKEGLILKDSYAKLSLKNFEVRHDQIADTTFINATGPLTLRGLTERGGTKTAIELLPPQGDSQSYSVDLYCTNVSLGYIDLYLTVNQPVLYQETFTIYCDVTEAMPGGQHSYANCDEYSTTVRINAGESRSETKRITLETVWPLGNYIRFKCVGQGKVSSYVQDAKLTELPENSQLGNDLLTFTQTPSSNNIRLTGNLIPSSNKYNLGAEGDDAKWNDIYTKNATLTGSDRNIKDNIAELTDNYERLFDNLRPVKYKFKQNESNRTHTGFIAQEVEDAVYAAGLTTQDFAAICYEVTETGKQNYNLRYGEFISLNTHMIQKLKTRVTELEQKNIELEERLARLEALINTQQND